MSIRPCDLFWVLSHDSVNCDTRTATRERHKHSAIQCRTVMYVRVAEALLMLGRALDDLGTRTQDRERSLVSEGKLSEIPSPPGLRYDQSKNSCLLC